MKKPYAKPLLYAEMFALVEHISAGCAYIAHFGASDCKVQVDTHTFFTTTANCDDEDAYDLLDGNRKATLEDFYAINMKCYNSVVDFTTGKFFVS